MTYLYSWLTIIINFLKMKIYFVMALVSGIEIM